MTKEEEQSIPPAVIATRAKKGLAIATGNPLDKIELNPKEVDKKQIQTEQTLIERVVSLMQRRKRALQMKRRKPRIVRARNIKKTRLATQDQLMRRAMRMAKTLLRKRAAGARGTSYNKLSSAQKLNIDRQIEPRTKNIKAMATRLMPRVKAGEMRRLNAVRSHKSTKGVYGNIQNLTQSYQPVFYSKLLGEKVSVEDLNIMFSMYEGKIISALTSPIRVAANVARGAAVTAAALQTPQTQAATTLAAANWATKKLANLGKADPAEDKKAEDEKHSKEMKANQQKMAKQALIQSIEKTKQAQLTTKKMQAKKARPSLSESFVVDRASGYSGVYTAKDLGIKIQGGFALHPSVEEEIGAGFEGTNKLTNKYKKDTPGEAVEAFARMMRAKRKANTPC